MNELFGLSMNYIMAALLVLLAIVFAVMGWVVLRNRVMFLVGVRNIPRRRAQTVLIVIGLMLSTTIISAAFSIGDTTDHSITSQIYQRFQSMDEAVHARSGDSNEFGGGADQFFGAAGAVSAWPMPEDRANRFVSEFRELPGVDGAVKAIRAPVPVVNERAGQTEPVVILIGLGDDPTQAFAQDFRNLQGEQVSVDDLARDEIYVNESAADKLAVRKGDMLTVIVRGQPEAFSVRDIVQDRVLTGVVFGEPKGLLLGLERAQEVLGRPRDVDFIAVSNEGGVYGGVERSDAVVASLNELLEGEPWEASAAKADSVEGAAEAASMITTFFVVLGLFSISAGMLLIFLIFVMLAAERRVELGMMRAVGTKRSHLIQTFMSEGMAYNVMAAAVGTALGVAVSLVMVRVMAMLFSAFDLSIAFNVTLRSLIVSYSLGVVLTFATVTFSSWRISNLNIVSAIREITDTASGRAGWWSFGLGALGILLGPPLMIAGWNGEQLFPFTFGFSLIVLGAALVARFASAPPRLVFTTAGIVLLLFWLFGAGNNIPFLDKPLSGGVEMFFLSGVAMVASATFVLVYNADLMLALVTFTGGAFTKIVPSIRTAVAYPLANKFRTGMTIAMISLVVFALVMMSTMNTNFERIFLGDDALGGYQVQVTENPSNPIADLEGELERQGFNTSEIERSDSIRAANMQSAQVRMAPQAGEEGGRFRHYPILGPTESFIANNEVKFQARAEGLETDADVWRRLAENPNAAVIDAFAIPGEGFEFGGPGFRLEGIKATDRTFEPLQLEVQNTASGETRQVEVVGIILMKASPMYFGLHLAPASFDSLFAAQSSVHYVRLVEGADAKETARGVERALLFQGAQADSLRQIIEENQELSRGFMYLIQGFMGLGLFVGIAAVGVIAFRTVVERRQQIGMLRALGYSRGAVALSFVMESSFITLLGVLSGIVLALLLAAQLVQSEEFSATGIDSFYIPWLQVIGVGLFAFLASLVMTIIPSRQASSIPIAEALRYE